MKKANLRILSFIMAMSMLISMFVIPASAESMTEDGFQYSVSVADGTATISGYYGDAVDLVIPSEIEGYTVTALGYIVYTNADTCKVKSISIPESITYMNDMSLVGFVGIESITVDPANEGLTSIDGVLYTKDMKKLICYPREKSGAEFVMPEGVERVGGYGFHFVPALESVTLPASFRQLGGCFNAAHGIKEIKVAEGNPYYSSVDGVLFSSHETALCKYPRMKEGTEYTVPDGVVRLLNACFISVNALEKITVPDSVVTIEDQVFSDLSSLKEVYLPNTISEIGMWNFETCFALEKIYYDGTEEMWSAFEITLPETVELSFGNNENPLADYKYTIESDGAYINSYIGDDEVVELPAYFGDSPLVGIYNNAFYNNDTVKKIVIPASVKSISNGAFYKCTSLENIEVAEESEYYYSIDGVLFDSGNYLIRYPEGKTQKNYSVPDGTVGFFNQALDGALFESVNLPASFSSTKSSIFENSVNLKSITVAEGNSYYTSIDGVLFSYDMTGLFVYPMAKEGASYQIPDGIKNIQYAAFRGASALESIVIPSSVNAINGYAFANCTKLNNVSIPNSLRSLGYRAFYGCDSLTSLYFAGTEEKWNTFQCANSMPDGVVITFGDEVDPLAGYEYQIYMYANPAYASVNRYNGSAEELTIPTEIDGYPVKQINYHGAFQNAGALKKITIPNSITHINPNAFYGCTTLESIHFNGVKAKWDRFNLNIPEGVTVTFGDEIDPLEGFEYGVVENADGKYIRINSYNGYMTDLVIPSEINGLPVKEINRLSWLVGELQLASVSIPASVTWISPTAFSNVTTLTSVTVDGTNEAYKSVDGVLYSKDGAKLLCYPAMKADADFTVPASVTFISGGMFAYAENLKNIYVEEGNQHYTNADGILYNIKMSEMLVYPAGKTDAEYVVPETVLRINDIRSKYLKKVVFHKNMRGYSSGMFAACSALEEIVVAEGSTNYKSIDGVLFVGGGAELVCYPAKKAGTSYTVPEGVVLIHESAFNHTELEHITIPCSVGTIRVLFDNITTLKSIHFEGTEEKWQKMNIHVSDNISLTFGDKVSPYDDYTFSFYDDGAVINSYNGTATEITLPSEVYGKTVLGIDWGYVFENAPNLEKVIIPNSFDRISSTAFDKCDTLVNIHYMGVEGKWNTFKVAVPEGVTVTFGNEVDHLEGVVYGINETEAIIYGYNGFLKEWIIPAEIEGYPVTKLLGRCNNTTVEKIVIPASVNTVGESFLNGFENLCELVVDEENQTYTVVDGILYNKAITEMWYYPKNKTDESYVAPDTLEYINCNIVSEHLKSIMLSASHRGWSSNTYRACTALEEIIVNDANRAYSSVDGVAFMASGKHLLSYPVAKKDTEYTVPLGTTRIGGSAFRGNMNLKKINIPVSVTNIEYYAFEDCVSLEEIYFEGTKEIWDTFGGRENIPEGVTVSFGNKENPYLGLEYVTENGEVIIRGYTGTAKEWTVPSEIDGCPVTKLDSCSYNNGLEKIIIPASVKVIESFFFNGMSKLAEVVVDENNEYYITVDGVLYNKEMTELVLYPNKTDERFTVPSTVSRIGMIRSEYLKIVTLPAELNGWDSSTFDNCPALEEIFIDSENQLFTSVYGVLYSKTMDALYRYPIAKVNEEYTVPNSVKTISSSAFAGCKALDKLVIPNSVVRIFWGAFRDSSIKEIYFEGTEDKWNTFGCVDNIPEGVTVSFGNKVDPYEGIEYTLEDGVAYIDSYSGAVKEWTIPTEINGYPAVLLEWAYFNANNLEKITVPASVSYSLVSLNTIYNLKEIVLEEGNETYTLSEGVLFTKDMKTLVCYPKAKAGTVYSIPDGVERLLNSSFADVRNLKEINIPASVEFIDGGTVFYYGYQTENIFVDDANEYYCDIDGVLFTKDKATLVSYPYGRGTVSYTVPEGTLEIGEYAFMGVLFSSVSLPEGLTVIGFYAFQNSMLKSISFPASVKVIEHGAFSYCYDLKSVSVAGDGSNIARTASYVGPRAFFRCTLLESVTLPNGIQSIGNRAFEGCAALKTLDIPASVTEIGVDRVFEGCASLTEINYAGTKAAWDTMIDGVDTGNANVSFGNTPSGGAVNYGDATGDGMIDGKDLVRIKKYIAGYDFDTNTSDVEIEAGADATGDGLIDGKDLVRLKKYIAAFDFDTGTSDVVLGPVA